MSGVVNHYEVVKALGEGWWVEGADGWDTSFVRVRFDGDKPFTKKGSWVEVTGGQPMVWVNLAVDGKWYPASLADRLGAFTHHRSGKPVKVGAPTTDQPCGGYVTGNNWGSGGHTCGKPCKAGRDLCGVHAGAADRRKVKEDARRERNERLDAEADRKVEAARAAAEVLERISPVLEELGLVPAVVKIKDGSFVVPPEMLESLVAQVVDVLGVMDR